MKKTIEIPEGYEARIEGNKVILESKESEDEKMIRIIEDAICTNEAQQLVKTKYGLELTNLADWLEKQGGQDIDISSFPKEQQVFMQKYVSLDKITLIKLLAERDANNAEIIESSEKQSEQRPVDKIEPKFKVGDWVVYKEKDVDKIVKFDNEKARFESDDWLYIDELNKDCKLWTIQDAKDGDVLANDTIVLIVDHLGTFENRPIIYSWYFSDYNKFYGPGPSKSDRWEVKGFHPATKEQCDLLFQKMKDAGYEWDTEKKKMKKIEQNPAWSEEDEEMVNDIIKAIQHLLKENESWGFLEDCLEWLKALKERYNWKPSDEQMSQLECVAKQNKDNILGKELMTLFNDLNKLKG